MESATLLEKPPPFSDSTRNIVLKIQTKHRAEIGHKIRQKSYDLSVNKVTSLERQCTISLYLSLNR